MNSFEPETGDVAELVGRLQKASSGMEGTVAATGKNESQDYSYSKASDVISLVREKLSEQGVMFGAECVELVEKDRKVGKYETPGIQATAHMVYSFRLGDAVLKYPYKASAWDSGDKAANKAFTMSLKYFLRDTFLLSFGEDAENDGAPGNADALAHEVTRRFDATEVFSGDEERTINAAEKKRLYAKSFALNPENTPDELKFKPMRDALVSTFGAEAAKWKLDLLTLTQAKKLAETLDGMAKQDEEDIPF